MAYIICYLTVYQIIDFNCGERGREEVGAGGRGGGSHVKLSVASRGWGSLPYHFVLMGWGKGGGAGANTLK